MSAYKDKNTNTWYVYFRYTDWTGEHKQKMKRGFPTKREALSWERSFLELKSADLSMFFEDFVAIYTDDMRNRIREHTWMTKENIIRTKLLPYFGKKKMCEIQTKDVIAWQNEMLASSGSSGKGYSLTYLKTLHNQLSAILNHAVRHYELKENAAAKVGPIGKKEATEMLFWTKDEYFKFADVMMDKPVSYYAFEILYWCGLRLGELLALTPSDFDFVKETVSVTKSYQRLKGEDVITAPKTPKSIRIVQMPNVLSEEMQEYLKMLYDVKPDERIFQISKSYLHHEMDRGCKKSGLKRIRIHDLRHSHVSLLIDMGFSALAIASRVGHESIDITYRYAHLFPSTQLEIAARLNNERIEGGF
ncbi:MAG: site-specific integrase [Eggerthellaceae bacterium]|nr:site-specific integrase [Eggerthellaceae bacterium]